MTRFADDSCMDSMEDLTALLRSRHPLLAVETDEESRFVRLLGRVADDLNLPVWIWSATSGLSKQGLASQYGTQDPTIALDFTTALVGPGVFIFADLYPFLDNPTVVRALKEATTNAKPGQTYIVTGPDFSIPDELREQARQWRLKPPSDAEIADLVDATLRNFVRRGLIVDLVPMDRSRMVSALRGLSLSEAERLLQKTLLDESTIDTTDIPKLRMAKAALLANDGILELVEQKVGTLDQVGGLQGLKRWLSLRERAVAQGLAEQLGLGTPRGILMTGIPGCGKSFVAKTLATTWGRPLVLLDPSRLYSKYIGETETRLTTALASIETMSPVVLWIDEIEKGFASSGEGDGGVSRRILGTFLRWMQDHEADVFIVATANDVTSLPPEFLRRGRFDEIFFVDLPELSARRAILELHMTRRNLDTAEFDIDMLAEATTGFSGAEIESSIVGALYRSLDDETTVTVDHILDEVSATVPLSQSRPEDIARLRAWAQNRAVPAAGTPKAAV
ncbi:ATP-dependent zinc metalloprotease FtsH 3 [bacterium BMS3Bbin02]|nr:ATP-dependent zinc metalloprotease FtsH 3 [bacterium BMS3Bbin02]HDH25871.1 AAA family ATPase [Actinomycetota bacterium]